MSSLHTDVGAYSLGLLEQRDRLDFEAHLGGCESCAAELAEFSHLADLLTGIEPVESGQQEPQDAAAETAAAQAAVTDLVRVRAQARSRQVRRQSILAVAASLVLLAGGAAAGIAAARPGAAPVAAQLIPGQRHAATNPATGITGTVGLVAKPWGTQVTLDLAKVRGPLECQLVAISASGQRRIVVGWFVPRAGYGVPGHPAHLILAGGTAISRSNLASVEIQVVHGGTLLTIPI
jgi:anti-sigma factor RsiW